MNVLMTPRLRVWLMVAAVLANLVNFAGVVMAAAAGEVLHTGVHAVLLLLGLYLVWRIAPRRRTAGY